MYDVKYTLDDMRILPQYSEVESRSKVDTSSSLFSSDGTEYKFSLPIIASPMPTVTEGEMLARMSLYGGLGILHRFKSLSWTSDEIYRAKQIHNEQIRKVEHPVFGASIGVNNDYLERLSMILEHKNVRVICIDIAHGHHILMKKAVEKVLEITPPHIHLMAGNIATYDGAKFLFDMGVNSARTGVGSGGVCSTIIQTGHGSPLAFSIREVKKANLGYKFGIIADGGIRNSGDIVKSLALGANFVMLGSLLAGTKASPGQVIKDSSGRWYKAYAGAASAESQRNAGKSKLRVEGVSSQVTYSGKLETVLESLKDGIQSGCSYSGALNIKELQKKAEFIIVSQNSHIEGTPHVLSR